MWPRWRSSLLWMQRGTSTPSQLILQSMSVFYFKILSFLIYSVCHFEVMLVLPTVWLSLKNWIISSPNMQSTPMRGGPWIRYFHLCGVVKWDGLDRIEDHQLMSYSLSVHHRLGSW